MTEFIYKKNTKASIYIIISYMKFNVNSWSTYYYYCYSVSSMQRLVFRETIKESSSILGILF